MKKQLRQQNYFVIGITQIFKTEFKSTITK